MLLYTLANVETSAAKDPHTASITMTKLQNPVKDRFEALNKDLRDISKHQKNFGKALDKVGVFLRQVVLSQRCSDGVLCRSFRNFI